MIIKKYKTIHGKVRYEVLDGGSVAKDNLTKKQAVDYKKNLISKYIFFNRRRRQYIYHLK